MPMEVFSNPYKNENDAIISDSLITPPLLTKFDCAGRRVIAMKITICKISNNNSLERMNLELFSN